MAGRIEYIRKANRAKRVLQEVMSTAQDFRDGMQLLIAEINADLDPGSTSQVSNSITLITNLDNLCNTIKLKLSDARYKLRQQPDDVEIVEEGV